jgi:hypothetical protein
MVHGISITLKPRHSVEAKKPRHFVEAKRLKSHFILISLIKDKYLLYNINEMTNISYTILMMIEIW